MSSPRRNAWMLLAGAGLVLVLALVPWGGSEQAEGADTFTYRFPVTVVDVLPGHVTERVRLVGDVVSNRRAMLAFQRAGRVSSVHADFGDEVPAGTVLARLDDAVLEQQLLVARGAAVARASQAQHARREAGRGNEVGEDILSASERDRRNADADAAEALAGQAVADEARLRAVLAQGELRAPFDAVVTERWMTDGSHAAAGATVFVVADMSRLEVHVEIPAPVAAGLPQGTEVTLTADALPGLVIDARLDLLVPSADLTTRTFRGIVRLNGLDPERRLLPGMFVRAAFVRRSVDAEGVVPVDAVQGPEDGPWVVAVADADGDVARFVPVRVLARNADHAAIEPLEPGALPAGARIVVTGADNVFPGAPLRTVPHGGEEPASEEAEASSLP